MKHVFVSKEHFDQWLEITKTSFKVSSRTLPPIKYPCAMISWIDESDYIGPDWCRFEFVYKDDFEKS